MQQLIHSRHKGVTLLEVLLVLVIMSGLLAATMFFVRQQTLNLQIDRAAKQMQQILNAGLAYYVNNMKWPADLTTLQAEGYLQASIKSPWNTTYAVSVDTNNNFLSVTLSFPATLGNQSTIAKIIAGKVPFAVVVSGAAASVTASVNLPSQELNNAASIHFAGLYHNGSCIPMPTCPVDKKDQIVTKAKDQVMIPQVFVVPVSVSGANDAGSPPNVYPITSFTAYATGDSLNPSSSPPACPSGGAGGCPAGGSPSGNFWRACVQVVTERGVVSATDNPSWGQYVTVAAFVRCNVLDEEEGSGTGIYSN